MSLKSSARLFWTRLCLGRSQFAGGYGRLRALYAVKDPWDLSSARERDRFVKTSQLICATAPSCQNLLELGCGEGYQTEHLLPLSQRVTGIDISGQAIARARARCPGAKFVVGRAEDAATLLAGERFDLVTAFEVLYYAKNIRAILADMQGLSARILVTNYERHAPLMTHCFEGRGWTRLDDLVVGDTVWWVHQWSDDHS